jgi:Kef-type K+ transport system membrane component KefB/mannitol/fructose-specific phosphotransferase system IIA component (Ntr-type)
VAEHDTLVFLLSLACLLGVARLFGELARKFGMPLVVGEILAGLILGPTILGRAAPHVHTWLFPGGGSQKMLDGYISVAVVLLLVVAGTEVDLGIVKRRGRSAFLTSVLGILLPLAGGLLLGFLLPDSDLVHPDQRVLFALFIGVALSISALPVIAKTLLDLGLFKSDIGLLIMGAAMINDLVGWLAFSVLINPMQGNALNLPRVGMTIALTVGFVTACLALGRPAVNFLLGKLGEQKSAPGRILSLLILLALFGAAATQAIGIHAVFGGFIVGITVGDSSRLKGHTRAVIHEFVTNIFAPVFFASLGLHVDFLRAFDLRLCTLVFVIATAAKVIGCTIGARVGGMRIREAAAVGFGLNARGAMEIILALLALDAGLIRERVFVALVTMAILTSLVSGPMMKLLLGQPREEEELVVSLLRGGALIQRLEATTSTSAISELIGALHLHLGDNVQRARTSVIEREKLAATGLGDGVAIPHAAVPGLTKPLLALGLTLDGIDFDAPDGKPANIVFLLLLPEGKYEEEVRVLASIARSVIDDNGRVLLLQANGLGEALGVLTANAKAMTMRIGSRSPPALADL